MALSKDKLLAPRALRGAMVLLAAVAACRVSSSAAAQSGPVTGGPAGAANAAQAARGYGSAATLRSAIRDLADTFGPRYGRAAEFLGRLNELERSAGADGPDPAALARVRQEALLANPLLDFDRLLLLRRARGQLGLPPNHICNAGLTSDGYDNELAVLSPLAPSGGLATLYRPQGTEFVGEMDLHPDGDRLLMTMPQGGAWHVHELRLDREGRPAAAPRRMTPAIEGADHFDACYLPDGGIAFASTACLTAVPCWHGQQRACSLYRLGGEGGLRQLCFDQDLDLHPSVLADGQIIYSRWDYTGPLHIYLRPLMAMNPDGTGQRAVFGSNAYWPNALYFPRQVPHRPGLVAAIVSGYHGVHRMGELVVLDLDKVSGPAAVRRFPGRPVSDMGAVRDNLVDASWPKFLHPLPLGPGHVLAAAQIGPGMPWGIYLADLHGNLATLWVEPGRDCFEPIPLRAGPRPPVIPDRTLPGRRDALIHLHDVYAGPGLAGVPRGTVRRIRVAAYEFGYPGLAGPDLIGRGGPWEPLRILGTVPVREDGSAFFRVPAQTPLTFQPLDAQGRAVQLMRSWAVAQPGEVLACVGCHETARDGPANRLDRALAAGPAEIEPWLGPARSFDFQAEIQPVLDRHCVRCHDGAADAVPARPDLRPLHRVPQYEGLPLSGLGLQRLHPDVRAQWPAPRARYSPAYDALVPFIRRVNIEDDVALLVPGEYHADTSPLIRMLAKGHHGVRLQEADLQRLYAWIDLNGPCHGTWSGVARPPGQAQRRRREIALRYAGVSAAEAETEARAGAGGEILAATGPAAPPAAPPPSPRRPEVMDVQPLARGPARQALDLGQGVTLTLVRVPAGRFSMGDDAGSDDDRPAGPVAIEREFWIGSCEVTNGQFRRFDPGHRSGLFTKRQDDVNGPGLRLEGEDQPVVRVSWERAAAFCEWLGRRTGRPVRLPTEAQWEWACRAGTRSALWFGEAGADFSACANLADAALARPGKPTGGLELLLEIPCQTAFDDRFAATAPVGGYRPNAWGLHDMHGNAAEWTVSLYGSAGRRVVRGGSFCDKPPRAGSGHRWGYLPWQRVHDVGFRVVCED